jgi:hypothetical protein
VFEERIHVEREFLRERNAVHNIHILLLFLGDRYMNENCTYVAFAFVVVVVP